MHLFTLIANQFHLYYSFSSEKNMLWLVKETAFCHLCVFFCVKRRNKADMETRMSCCVCDCMQWNMCNYWRMVAVCVRQHTMCVSVCATITLPIINRKSPVFLLSKRDISLLSVYLDANPLKYRHYRHTFPLFYIKGWWFCSSEPIISFQVNLHHQKWSLTRQE